jgi:signal transduction histidine kinase
MKGLIRDFLDMAKIEGGSLVLSPRKIELKTLIGDVLDSLQPLADESSVKLVFDAAQSDCVLVCDPDRILQVFGNLVGNAIKFSKPGALVRIRLDRCDSERVSFSVVDYGPGISAEEQRHLFQPYWQGKGGSEYGGAGLGLFITKGIIEAHAGMLSVQSEVGHGSTFSFTLPQRQEIPLQTQSA